MRTLLSLTLILGITLLISCKQEQKNESINPTIIYGGGDIITMQGDSPEYTEALVVRGNEILFVGSLKDAKSNADEGYKYIDLEGNTLLPGFIDGHGLEKGKLADMVILNKNPLKVQEEDIKKILVLETIKEGVSVYKK